MQEINTEIYLKKKKIKRENMKEIDIIIYLKKKKKQLKECQKIIVKLIKAESLNSIKSYVSMHCLSSIMS